MSAGKQAGETIVIVTDNNAKKSGVRNTPETITDIQNYLERFNKEIEVGGDGATVTVQAIKIENSENVDATISNSNVNTNLEAENDINENNEVREEEGTYFVDSSGRYYYRTSGENGQEMVAVVQGPEDNVAEIEAENQSEEVQVLDDSGQVVLGSNGDTYQTVTIVPSETNTGEVSYVLIVQQDDKEAKTDDQDLTVYDFNDGEEPGVVSAPESEVEEEKSKVMKMVAKKSQTVTQAHMCNYCNYTSPKRYLLSRHMKSHSEERPHKCSVCDRGFKTLASLQNHVNTHTGTKPHKCKYCPSAFTTSGELVRHVRYKHTHEKPHKCTLCDYASVELSKMRNHMRCHTGERPYQCPHCTYASPDTFKLKRHLRIHTGEKPYTCEVCQARFTQSNSLKAHRLIHTGEKPIFQCELCPATCGRKTDLRIHVQKLHTSDQPLKCKRCGKQFPDRYSYKVHNKSHEGEKCWRCELCPYASISQRHLESHMLIHTDQKPYACDECDQAFRQKQLLKRHQNLYHNPGYIPPAPKEKTHECPECHRAFRHKGNLLRHMSAHDPDSEQQQRNMALKLGRQKKVHVIDGQQVEVMPETPGLGSDSESDVEGVVALEGNDGEQYVVLEVIQLPDGEGGQVTVLNSSDPASIEDTVISINTENGTIEEATEIETKDNCVVKGGKRLRARKPKVEKMDMDTCFGFDDDDLDDDDKSHDIDTKAM